MLRDTFKMIPPKYGDTRNGESEQKKICEHIFMESPPQQLRNGEL